MASSTGSARWIWAFHLLTVAPAVALGGWLVTSLPLLLVDEFHPAPAIVLAVAVSALLLTVVVRSPGPAVSRGGVVAAGLTVVIAGTFAALAWTTSSSHVIVRRDPAVYAQTADWLAEHGSLPIPVHSDAFGDTARLIYGSQGFYEAGHPPHVVPQFMTGTSLAITPAGWLAGLDGITHANAVIGALALLAVAGLAARLVGIWAAPLVALTLLTVFPNLHQAQSTYSEPAAQLLLFAGLSLLVDARRAPSLASRDLPVTGGLLIGLVALVRVDAFADLIPMIGVLVVFAIAGRTSRASWTAIGFAVGIGLALVDAFAVTHRYVLALKHQLIPIAAVAAVVLLFAWLALWQRSRLARVGARWSRSRWPTIVGITVPLLAAAGYFVAPHLPKQHYDRSLPVASDIMNLQIRLGLPRDPRTYAEQATHWLTWWLGVPMAVLAFVALGLLVRRVLRNGMDEWLPLVFVLTGTTAIVLSHPAVTPDHPWADRRFVAVVFPGLIVVAAWLVHRVVQRASRRTTRQAAVVLGVAAMVGAPIAASTPLWGHATERGEIGLIDRACTALPAHAAVIIVGGRGLSELPQVLRGGCSVPVAIAPFTDTRQVVAAAASAARARGYTPIVVALSKEEAAAASSGTPTLAASLVTREDGKSLTKRPTRTNRVTFQLWYAEP